MEFHPVSEIFPLMSDKELDDLAADIKANGLREPIWTWQGKIIDGRNRYISCGRVGVDPAAREWDGNGDLADFVWSLNFNRRHLTASQRGMAIARRAAMKPCRPKLSGSKDPLILTNAEAAKIAGVGTATVKRAKRILREAPPDVISAVESGKTTVVSAEKKLRKRRDLSKGGLVDNSPLAALALASASKATRKADRVFDLIQEVYDIAHRPSLEVSFVALRGKVGELRSLYIKLHRQDAGEEAA